MQDNRKNRYGLIFFFMKIENSDLVFNLIFDQQMIHALNYYEYHDLCILFSIIAMTIFIY
jgi:hypothetical protein